MSRRRNAPLKGARAIGSNMTEVEHGDLTILYSYKTPVAILAPSGGYRTQQQWSVTTAKHIRKFFDLNGYDFNGAKKIPQEDIEAFAMAGEVTGYRGPEGSLGGRPRSNPRHQGVPAAPSPDDPYPDPGKFEGERMLAVEMYESAMESGADEEGGDSGDGPGYFWLFLDFEASDGSSRNGILLETPQGFIGLTEYDTATDAAEAWEEEIAPMLDEYFAEEEAS